jgi:hypothetical protein
MVLPRERHGPGSVTGGGTGTGPGRARGQARVWQVRLRIRCSRTVVHDDAHLHRIGRIQTRLCCRHHHAVESRLPSPTPRVP